nr:hypothetical protein BaRGS_000772 [Batillaria attramentaria]
MASKPYVDSAYYLGGILLELCPFTPLVHLPHVVLIRKSPSPADGREHPQSVVQLEMFFPVFRFKGANHSLDIVVKNLREMQTASQGVAAEGGRQQYNKGRAAGHRRRYSFLLDLIAQHVQHGVKHAKPHSLQAFFHLAGKVTVGGEK